MLRHRSLAWSGISLAALLLAPCPAIAGPRLASAPSLKAVPVPPRPGELDGTVKRTDGAPVSSFTVNGVRFDDARGVFHVLVPPMGDFRMVIRCEGLAPSVVHVTGASGKKLRVPEIALGQGEDVFGEVLDAATGEPVVAARVALADPPQIERLRLIRPERLSEAATTGRGGYFQIKRAPRARILLVVHHPDYLPEFVPIDTKGARPTVLMHRGGGITGTVRGATGQPLPSALVTAVSDVVGDAQEARSDSTGHFELRGLRPGQYVVLARASGAGGALDPQPVVVAEGGVASVGFLARGARMRMDLDADEGGAARSPAPAPRKRAIMDLGADEGPAAPAPTVRPAPRPAPTSAVRPAPRRTSKKAPAARPAPTQAPAPRKRVIMDLGED